MSSSSIYGSAGSPITISGLASGINTSGIITSLEANSNTAIATEQSQETALNTALAAWQAFNGGLSALQGVAQSLSSPSAFNTTAATIDQSSVASVTAEAGASIGTHTLSVASLAQAQKVLSSGFSDPSTPLNFTGGFVLNGKSITVTASDTLTSLAAKINSAGAGVQASVLSSGTGNYQLSLTSSSTGTLNAMSVSDMSGSTALESLGLVPSTGATVGLRQAITTSSDGAGAGSMAFANATGAIGGLLGLTSGQAASGSVTIDGTSVSLDLNTMSLTDVANAINSAGITGVQAQIVSIPDANGNVGPLSQKQLQIISTSTGTPISSSSFTDSGGVLSSLGVLQTGFADQVSAAKDAAFTLDGVGYTRSSNTVNDAITGVSMTLLSASTTTPATTANITVSQDASSITTSINSFVTSYNAVNDYINQQFAFTPDNSGQSAGQDQTTPPLFGDFTLTNIQNQLSGLLNATNGSASLASIGITVNASGDLQVDSGKLQTALTTNPSQVAGLFGVSGSSTNSAVSFVTASVKTQASSGVGYAVNVTQPATQASVTGTAVYSAPTQAETLSFSGGLFGSASKLAIPAGTSLADTVNLINGDSNLNQYLYASQSPTGALVLTSKGYGSNQSFSVSSSLASGGSGIGSGTLTGTGTDVAGTINGEAATGIGQSLTGNAGNVNTDGLQLLVTATSAGSYGSVTVGHGVADQLNALVTSVTDPATGSIATAESAINSQISDVQAQVTALQSQLSTYTTYLETEFANMEQSVSELQSQQSALASAIGSSTASTSGSTSSSSSSGSSTA